MTWSTSLTRLSQDWSVWKIWPLRGATWRPYRARLCLTCVTSSPCVCATSASPPSRTRTSVSCLRWEAWRWTAGRTWSTSRRWASRVSICPGSSSPTPTSARCHRPLQEPGLPDGPEPLLQPHLHARVLAFRDLIRPVYMWFICFTCMSCDRERVKIVCESLKMQVLHLLKWGKTLKLFFSGLHNFNVSNS